MVKAFYTAVIALIIVVLSSFYEQIYLKKSFEEFREVTLEVYSKTEEQTAIKDDVLAVQNLWLEKKKTLHVFIPHNDIKEVDLWISEAVTLVEKKMWEDALSKLEVVIEMSEQIPKTYTLKLENIL
ncbi:MAG: DUF4363 family protein [Clostridiales bacterium]|nr:DUF4363 family protein [Clostridiales bacterium]